MAGYSLTPYGLLGTAILGERQIGIPAIASPSAQLRNRTLLAQTLGQLLQQHPRP